MGKKQHRRSLSLRPEVFARLRLAAHGNDMSITAYAEQVLMVFMDTSGVPRMNRDDALVALSKRPPTILSEPAPTPLSLTEIGGEVCE